MTIACTGGFWRPYFLYVGVCAAYALCAGAVVAFLAPAAAGSGMPEMKVPSHPLSSFNTPKGIVGEHLLSGVKEEPFIAVLRMQTVLSFQGTQQMA
jgi:H+/Cl- antiporter ClcA